MIEPTPTIGSGGEHPALPTIRGPLPPDAMGTTLVHEHVLYGQIPNHRRAESVAFAVELLNDAARVGIDTLVDLSPARDITLYQEIALQTPVNILVSTGAYLAQASPQWILDLDEKQVEERMFREVTEGIDGTGIRAAIIKVAGNRSPLTEWEKMNFRCAARVNAATRVPIACHTIFEPREQFDILVKNGANPTQTFFSHVEAEFGWGGRTREQMADVLLGIAEEGGRFLFNNFGYEFHTPWEDLVFLIRHLCERGHSSSVLISIDCYWQWKDDRILVQIEDRHPEVRRRTHAYMITDTVPALLKAGFSARDVRTFLIENPRDYFTAGRSN